MYVCWGVCVCIYRYSQSAEEDICFSVAEVEVTRGFKSSDVGSGK